MFSFRQVVTFFLLKLQIFSTVGKYIDADLLFIQGGKVKAVS